MQVRVSRRTRTPSLILHSLQMVLLLPSDQGDHWPSTFFTCDGSDGSKMVQFVWMVQLVCLIYLVQLVCMVQLIQMLPMAELVSMVQMLPVYKKIKWFG